MNLVQYIFDRKTKNSTTKYPGSLLASYPGGTPYSELHGEGPPERVPFLSSQSRGGGTLEGSLGGGVPPRPSNPDPV